MQAKQPNKLFRSEELLQKYEEMMAALKEKSVNAIITGIIPRLGAPNKIYSRIMYINRAVQRMANKKQITYSELGRQLQHSTCYDRDGIHLSFQGRQELGAELHYAIQSYQNQNTKSAGNGQHLLTPNVT
jgi:lysophospholipase L1-like esterase